MLDSRGRLKIFSPLLQPLLLSYKGSLHSALPLSRLLGKEEERVDPSLFSTCTLQGGNLLLSSGYRAVLLPLPSSLLAPLPWPSLHLAKARLILTGDGESALVQSMLSKENKEQSTRTSLAWSAKEKVKQFRRRLGLETGITKL